MNWETEFFKTPDSIYYEWEEKTKSDVLTIRIMKFKNEERYELHCHGPHWDIQYKIAPPEGVRRVQDGALIFLSGKLGALLEFSEMIKEKAEEKVAV